MQEMSIDIVGFSVRTLNCLKRSGIFYCAQVMSLTEDDMRKIKNMGTKSIQEVVAFQERFKEMSEATIVTKDSTSLNIISAPILLLHKAFPELIGKQIHILTFKDKDGIFRKDVEIASLELPLRTKRCLDRNNITKISEIALMEILLAKKLKNFGEKNMDEIICFLRDNTHFVIDRTNTNVSSETTVELIYGHIEQSFKEEKKEFKIEIFEISIKEKIYEFLSNKTENILDETKDIVRNLDLMKSFLVSNSIIDLMEKYLYSYIGRKSRPVSLVKLKENIPEIFFELEIVSQALEKLELSKRVEKTHDGYRRWLPNLQDWLQKLEGNERIAISLRMEGKTLEECGRILGVTRERVRQITLKAIKRKPLLREDDFEYWFTTYFLDYEAMSIIFDVDESIFNYLSMVYKRGNESVDIMCEDKNLTAHIYSNLQRYYNRNSILIDGEYVLCKRELLCRELARSRYSKEETAFDIFYEEYLSLLKDNNRATDEKLLFPSERAFEARLQDSQFILMKYGRRFRYYPIHEYDVEAMVEAMHLEQFKDVEISTLKLFNQYPEIMTEYDIHDEYELHNLLKKTEDIWGREQYDVVLTRMPFMAFGKVDRAKQTQELLFQIAPVTIEEFGEFYETEYGVLARTAQANMSPYIANYYHNGVYKIDQPIFSEEEYNYMSQYLQSDFYFIEDVKNEFIKEFGDDNASRVNPRTLKELGYKIFANYIIKSTYSSAEEYFVELILKESIIDLTQWDTKISYIQTANQALDMLRSQYDILEYEDRKYLKYDHFRNIVPDMEKDDFRKYTDEAIRYSGENDFFSITSLKRKGFDHPIHHLGLTEWFSAALVKHSKKIRFIKVGGGILFYKGEKQKTTVDFLKYLMNEIRKINIEDFILYIQREYGVTILREKMTILINASGMYYDSIMEKVYFTKEEYYDDF